MQAVLQFIPGFVAASTAFGVTKIFRWTESGFEFGVFIVLYSAVAVAVDRGMKRYGASKQ
jgi:hypothetical protein